MTLPNGYYSVSALNEYIQQVCILNGLYLVDGNGNNVYYLELAENSQYYSIQLNCFGVPTSLPSGYTAPSNWIGYPNTAYTPQLVVPSTNFTDIIGFSSGTYPATQQTSSYSVLSTFTPQVSTVSSVILSCNLLNNRFAIPNSTMYSFTAGDVGFGNIIEKSPLWPQWIDAEDGVYPYIEISFLDQSFNALQINDTNLVVTLFIRT